MYLFVCTYSWRFLHTQMKPHYLKKCDSIRATEEMPLMSLYCVLGNEYCRATELPAIALSSPASSDTSAFCNYHDTAEAGRRMMRSPDLEVRTRNSKLVSRCELIKFFILIFCCDDIVFQVVGNWQSECFFGTEISTSMGVNFR